ncbi:MAG: glycosyltransferase [Deltaproteobacteria bacterium]|nr:glycosyltransferase [Deltaproteobacteria bacterium]
MQGKNILHIVTGNIIIQRDSLILSELHSSHTITLLFWGSVENEKRLRSLGFRIITFKARNKLIFFLKVFLHILLNHYDVISFSSFLLSPLVLLATTVKKTKILYGYHEFPIATATDRFNNLLHGIVNGIARTLENAFLKTSDGIIVIPLIDKEIQRVLKYNKNMEVVSNFPSLAVKLRAAGRLKDLKDKRFIIYSGTIASYTGLHLYLDVTKRLIASGPYSDVTLVLAGKLSGINEPDLHRVISSMNLEQSVVYLGWIPYEELLSVISRAMVGLALFDPNHLKFSYISEGTSRKIYTYMYCGIPVITNPPLGEFVRHEKCGIVIPYNIEELYSAVVNLLRDDDLRRNLGQNGKNAVLTKYNWERESEKVIKVFENMWSIKQCCRK